MARTCSPMTTMPSASRSDVFRLLVIDTDGRLESFEPSSEHLEIRRESDERAAIDRVRRESPDLVLLPLSRTPGNSLRFLAHLRRTSGIGIVTLGATNQIAEGIQALEAGADDHLLTPFHDVELFARLRAVRRRTAPPAAPLLVSTRGARLIIDLAAHEVTLGGQRLHLTGTELRLLEVLVTNPGVLLTHRTLLERVWGEQYGTESNYLRVYVARLRKQLRDPADHPELIETATGIGYRWIATSTALSPDVINVDGDASPAVTRRVHRQAGSGDHPTRPTGGAGRIMATGRRTSVLRTSPDGPAALGNDPAATGVGGGATPVRPGAGSGRRTG